MSETQCPICGSLSDSERHNQLKKEYGELKVKEFKILLENAALQKRIAELEASQVKSKKMLQRARKDIMETARTSQMRLTGVDFVTGDTGCPKKEIHQRGIDESLLLCGEINDLIRDLPPMPEVEARVEEVR